MAVSISLTASTADGTDQTTYTFASQALGSAAADRNMYAGIFAAAGAPINVSSITINGVSASTAAVNNPTANSILNVYGASVPTGTTGDVVITLSSSAVRCALMLYAAYGGLLAPSTTATNNSEPMSTTIASPAGGAIIGFASHGNTGTISWTGLTRDVTANIETQTYSAASITTSSSTTPTVTATNSVTGSALHGMTLVSLAQTPTDPIWYGQNADAATLFRHYQKVMVNHS